MREMKDSGVEWIGKVPNDWDCITIGSLFKVRNEKVNDTDYPPLSVTKGGIVPQMETVAKSDATDNRKKVLKNDFVINSRSDRKQSCGVSPLDGSVSLINTVLYPAESAPVKPSFLNYLLKNHGFAEEFYRWGHGIVADLWTTRWQEMKSILLPIPPLSEQQAIVSYLDAKCGQVDALVKNVEAQIEKLKAYKQSLISEVVTKGLDPNAPLKDSGIEWIGKMPAHWDMVPMKILGAVRNGLTYSPDEMCDENEGTLVLRSSNIQEGRLVFDDCVYVTKKISEELKVSENDILICSRNGSRKLIGKNAIISRGVDASFGAFMMIFRTKQNAKYCKYILDSSIFQYYLGSYLTATINQLTAQNFKSMEASFTFDATEQQAIADFLDRKCSQIDRLIGIKQRKIAVLEQYKKSLIYEVVTGKANYEL